MKKLFLVVLAAAALLMAAPTVRAQDWALGDPWSVQTNGAAMAVGQSSVALVQGQLNARATAFTMDQVRIDRSFLVSADFLLGPAGTRYTADGIAFCLQTEGPGALGALGGRGMGFYGISRYVCVALNNYTSDASGPRQANLGAVYETGERPRDDGSGETPLPSVSLIDNRVKNIAIEYDWYARTLWVTVTDSVSGRSDWFSAQKDLEAVLGRRMAYLGATVGTGTFSQEALLLSLSYWD